jgi:hypothetical protein
MVMKDLLDKADKFVSGPVWNGIVSFMQSPGSSSGSGSTGNTSPTKGFSGPIIDGKARPTNKIDQ